MTRHRWFGLGFVFISAALAACGSDVDGGGSARGALAARGARAGWPRLAEARPARRTSIVIGATTPAARAAARGRASRGPWPATRFTRPSALATEWSTRTIAARMGPARTSTPRAPARRRTWASFCAARIFAPSASNTASARSPTSPASRTTRRAKTCPRAARAALASRTCLAAMRVRT